MKKVDATVKRETLYVAAFVVILSAVMQAVFLILHRWNLSVLLSNLLGGAAAVGNFFLMGLTVQYAVGKEEKAIRHSVKLSQSLRLLLLFVIAALGVGVKQLNPVAVILPLFFPRVAFAVRAVTMKKTSQEGENNET